MSIKAMTWVFENSKAALADRLVLLAIADHADDLGMNAWPSLTTIASKAHLSERQVRYSLRRLEKMGELATSKQAGPNGTNLYRIVGVAQPQLFSMAGANPAPLQNLPPAAESGHSTASFAPESSFEQPTPRPPSEGAPPFEAFLGIWNENCGDLPKIRGLTKGRREKLRQRLKAESFFASTFLAAVVRAAETPFLSGKNPRGWRCNFDWLIQTDTNVARVLEGAYDRAAGAPREKVTGALPAPPGKYKEVKPHATV